MIQKYSSTVKLRKELLENVPIEHDKEFIIQFLRGLPTEKLKQLVSFEEIDFKNPLLWDNSRESQYLYEKLVSLKKLNVVEYNVTITL